jgi:regulator of protease activity HflC (stomatin/prohibitin superfamily)
LAEDHLRRLDISIKRLNPPELNLDGVRRIIPFFIIVVGLIFLVINLRMYREISAEEVGIKVNYLSGNQEIITQPGIKFHLPIVQEIFILDKTPNKFVMEGSYDLDANRVQKLTVRAMDGSNFWFDSLEIQYQILTAEAGHVLNESGPGEEFKQFWIRSLARSVLRDEFGRFSVAEVTDPTKYGVAIEAAQRRLNDMLQPHGLLVVQLICPKPKFDAAYEKAIEQRKVANQEVERLKAQREKLTNARKTELASVNREKEVAKQELTGDLESARLAAEQARIKGEKTADAYQIERTNAAAALLQEAEIQAKGLSVKYRNEIDGLRKEISAYATDGRGIVWREYARKIAEMKIDVVPYQQDPAPDRLEIEGVFDRLNQSAGGAK